MFTQGTKSTVTRVAILLVIASLIGVYYQLAYGTKYAVFGFKNNVDKKDQSSYTNGDSMKAAINDSKGRTDPADQILERNKGISDRLKKIYEPLFKNKTWLGRSTLIPRSSERPFQMDEDIRYFIEAVQNGALNFTFLSEYNMEPHMTDWEWKILKQPPLQDLLDAGNQTTSKVHIVAKQPQYKVGDTLRVRVDIYNGRGDPMTSGGDDVRVWAVDLDQKASMASEVKDLKNGSYTAEVILLWAGNVEIRTSLVYPRHAIRAFHFLTNVLKGNRLQMAGFQSNFASEATMCSCFPRIPEFDQLCDFTEENGGHPWFCGKPKSPYLTCKHWNASADIPRVTPIPFTPAELKMFKWLWNRPAVDLIGKQEALKVKVKNVPSKSESTTKPMLKYVQWSQFQMGKRRRLSWQQKAPTGYFRNKSWVPRHISAPELTGDVLTRCLKNTTVILLGDSNLRLMIRILGEKLKCNLQRPDPNTKQKWHHPLFCKINESDIDLRWNVHSMPFHPGIYTVHSRFDSRPINEYMDEIPSSGRFVVLVHMYLHLSFHHYSVFAERMEKIYQSTKRLLRRNPDSEVVIRGPHAVLKGLPKQDAGDMIANRFAEIIKNQFADLQDRVWYLHTWDMTVAVESEAFHPLPWVNENIARLFLAYVCK